MNFKRFGSLLPDNPLCGINTYKDELNLATGDCTRNIAKLVFDGTEDWSIAGGYSDYNSYFRIVRFTIAQVGTVVCTHYVSPDTNISVNNTVQGVKIQSSTEFTQVLIVRPPEWRTWNVDNFKAYLAAQYAAGTPVTVWYVLAEPTTETITVPFGLSGTEEGYLNQSGTPTPTNPIYPTANTVEKWFDINHYIMGTSTDTLTTLPADIYANDTTATVGLKGNMSQSSTPSPTTPIQPQECGDLETSGAKAGQYKISVLSNSTTTPVYLGEVESTRRIKKLVLTSESDFDNAFGYNGYIYVQKSGMLDETIAPFCNCLVGTTLPVADAPVNSIKQGRITNQPYPAALIFKLDGITTMNQFLSFLSAMNSAGTPVTVWYVLAEPTTTTLNEPLRKIGDYADEVSGITIPTIAGANTLSIGTTLQPSEVSVNYHGWHPVSAVHERENGQWD